MMNYLVGISTIILSTTACFSQLKNYEKLAVEKYTAKDVQYLPNTTNTYMLCISETKGTAQLPQNYLRYFVYDLKGDSVLHDGTLSNGTIEWYSATQIAIYKRPGIMAEGQTIDDYITLFDVQTKVSKLKSKR